MPLLHCHKCGAELSADSSGCPHCGIEMPFVCAVCAEPIGSLAEIGWAYPFTKEGKPLCPVHAQRLCDACHKPFSQESLTKRISSWDFVESAKEYFQTPGHYCEKCNAMHIDPAKPKPRAKMDALRLTIYGVVAAIIILLLLLLKMHR